MRTALLPLVVAVVGLGAAGLAALPSQAPEMRGDIAAAAREEGFVDELLTRVETRESAADPFVSGPGRVGEDLHTHYL